MSRISFAIGLALSCVIFFGGGAFATAAEVPAFGNIVPTGPAISGDTVYMAEVGPLPPLPQNGKVISFDPQSPVVSDSVSDVASGPRLLVDVEFGADGRLYALAQGEWAGPGKAGTPPLPNTGILMVVNEQGSFTSITDGLDQPISVDFIDEIAYAATLTGNVLMIDMQETCTLDTIAGTYLFQAQGVVVDEDGEMHAYAEAGAWTLDGKGNAAGVLSASVDGEIRAYAEAGSWWTLDGEGNVVGVLPASVGGASSVRGKSFTATYELASDCVFTAANALGLAFELYTTPSGESMTYFSPGFSGTQVRQ